MKNLKNLNNYASQKKEEPSSRAVLAADEEIAEVEESKKTLILSPYGIEPYSLPPWQLPLEKILNSKALYWTPAPDDNTAAKNTANNNDCPDATLQEKPPKNEAEAWARNVRARELDNIPTRYPTEKYPVGSWAANRWGELAQLRAFDLHKPEHRQLLVFREGGPEEPRLGMFGFGPDPLFEANVTKYQNWIERGFCPPPPAHAVESDKGLIVILDGHHRAAALYRCDSQKSKFLVWVTVTGLFWDTDLQQYNPRSITHLDYVKYALGNQLDVPESVLAAYQGLKDRV